MIEKLLGEPYISDWSVIFNQEDNILGKELSNQPFAIRKTNYGFVLVSFTDNSPISMTESEVKDFILTHISSIERSVMVRSVYAFYKSKETIDPVALKTFTDLSRAEKCRFLEIEDYLSDPDLSKLIVKFRTLRETYDFQTA